ncbi:MAG: hypothetical protein HY036_10525 [Nitrospirae bacterium]|nr:hypothetical protein [Nitrospirota bacterium]MBI3352997.1 hypothetical protein [Nitrospirota bacterium]
MNFQDIEKIKKTLARSGHIFEYQVCDLFEKNGWMIVPNRFYLDKDEDKGREIDLVAYKISEVKPETAVITVVVVEAKQSLKNKWVFFTKGDYSGSINLNNYPLFYLNEILELETSYPDQEKFKGYLLNMLQKNNLMGLFNFEYKAHSYAEVSEAKDSQKTTQSTFFNATNASDIHGAIFPVIKAISSELALYENRKIATNEKRFYWVFPLVVFNGEILEARVKEGNIDLLEKDEIQYVTRYTSKRYDDFYSINVIRWQSLIKYINLYNQMHETLINQINADI